MSPTRLYEPLEWDSEHFGRPIARLRPRRPSRQELLAALGECDGAGIDCLYLLADADHPPTRELAAETGFALTDVRLELERPASGDAGRSAAATDPLILLRDPRAEDLAALEALAGAAHVGTRFYADSRFPDPLCDRLYQRWVARSVEGWADAVVVADCDGQVAGYVTCHLRDNAKVGTIGLIAVSPALRGHGLGRALIAAAADRLAGGGAEAIQVVTQGANVAAQRLYQGAGFRTREVGLWYHRWRPGSDR